MDTPTKSFNEDALDPQLIAQLKGWEWIYFRKKCRSVGLEQLFWRYVDRVASTNVMLFIYTIELLLGIHICVLFFLASSLTFYGLLPYIMAMILTPAIMCISLKEPTEFQHFYALNVIASCVIALMLTLMDTFVQLFQDVNYPLVPSYDHIVVSSIYLFLPISFYENGKPYLLGLLVSTIYLIYVLGTLNNNINDPMRQQKIISYGIYLLYLNVVFSFFRALTEFNLRKKILSRYQLLRESNLLKLVVKNEKMILETILPRKIARSMQDDVRARIEDECGQASSVALALPRKLFVEPHPEVSILVADMVNYTHLTTTLDVADLVDILHELFVAYDRSAEHFNVLRIKFLGDAYNCVSGIPLYNPEHATCCMNQGLEMIKATRNSRERRKLNIDMRIGVHSGEVFSGIIGRTKWEFDIWSKDVDITNRLESSGMPGKVHISERTLNLLENQYLYEEGSKKALDDPILKKNQIVTYLVTGPVRDLPTADTVVLKDDDGVSDNSFHASIVDEMQLSDVYKEVQQETQLGMKQEVEKMPVGITHIMRIVNCYSKNKHQSEDYLLNADISDLLVLFRNGTTEWNYINLPDFLMKYSMLTLLGAGTALVLMCFSLPFIFSQFLGTLSLLLALVIICLVTNYKKLWLQYRPLSPWSRPKFILSRGLMSLSELLEDQLFARMLMCVVAIFIIYSISSLKMIFCNLAEFELELIESDLSDQPPNLICFTPWTITHGIIVALSVLLLFFGLPMIFKLCLALIIVATHIVTVHAKYGFAFERSATTNVGLKAEDAHTLYLFAFFIMIAIKERHITYMNKVDYYVKLRYEEKHAQTQNTTRSIRIIMANLLPSHVANDFLERRRLGELYYENFDKVAVMFATIENYEADRMGIRVLNEFICHFDDVLQKYTNKYKVEKIKVMGWTYMAACGLQVEHYADFSLQMPTQKRSNENVQYLRAKSSSVRFDFMAAETPKSPRDIPSLLNQNPLLELNDEVVVVMTQFAVDLLRVMQNIKTQDVFPDFGFGLKGTLKIGISHGPVMAGVVGLSKPHYDIWGHPVNMASRMTSTSIMGFIQVTEATASILRKCGIRCTYRGETFVKGIGEIPTYLVALDKSLNFQLDSTTNDDTDSGKAEEILLKKSSNHM